MTAFTFTQPGHPDLIHRDYSNAIENPGLETEDANNPSWILGTGWSIVSNAANARTGNYYAEHDNATGGLYLQNGPYLDTAEGQFWYLECYARSDSSAGTRGQLNVVIRFYDKDLVALVAGPAAGAVSATTTYTRGHTSGTAPAAAVYARAEFIVIGATLGKWRVDDCLMTRGATLSQIDPTGTLTVDDISINNVTNFGGSALYYDMGVSPPIVKGVEPLMGEFLMGTGAGIALGSVTGGNGITVTPSATPAVALALTATVGTAGAGFVELKEQSAAPSAPTNATRLYCDSNNRLAWIGENGFKRTIDGTANTADRTYTLPDASGTIALTASSVSFTRVTLTQSGTTGAVELSAAAMKAGLYSLATGGDGITRYGINMPNVLTEQDNTKQGAYLSFDTRSSQDAFSVAVKAANSSTETNSFAVTSLGNVIAGAKAVLSTAATDGFLYIPYCAGAPTGTPTTYTGKVAIVFDRTNKKIYVYDTATNAWKQVALV